ITATYGGDTIHSGSSGSTGVIVTAKRSTSTSVGCRAASVVVGQATTCTAAVSDTDTSTRRTPAGTVSFGTSRAASFRSPSCTLSGTRGTASCSVPHTPTALRPSTQTITATYGGDTTHGGSAGTTTVTVSKRSTSTSVGCTPASVVVGQPTTCTATVNDTDV